MIFAGMGCTSRATSEEMRLLLMQVAQGRALAALACLEGRAHLCAPVARALSVPLLPLSRRQLDGISTLTQSPRMQAAFGTGSVAEACALFSAGTGARLIVARQISGVGQATCALAEGEGR